MKILVLNGPNLNMLGHSGEAGEQTLAELDKALATYGVETHEGLELVFYQTNHEGQLIDMIQRASQQYDGLIFNPAAYRSYSLVLRDAVRAASLPVVEVQLTFASKNEGAQEESVIAPACVACFSGVQQAPYREALDFLVARL